MNKLAKFIRSAFGIDEIIELLDSIDSRLMNIEGCVREGERYERGPTKSFLATGGKYE